MNNGGYYGSFNPYMYGSMMNQGIGLGAARSGASSLGGAFGSAGLGASRLGAAGLGASHLGATGLGASRLGATGLGASGLGRAGLGGAARGLLGKFSWSGLLTGAGKTLNVVNQAIPVFYQVKPIFNNARTMFKVLGAIKSDSKSETREEDVSNNNARVNTNVNSSNYTETPSNKETNNSPTFFL